MSKQGDAKKKQNYNPKPEHAMCMNCQSYTSEKIDNGYGYLEEKNKRCGVGGFAIMKTGTCTEHKFIAR